MAFANRRYRLGGLILLAMALAATVGVAWVTHLKKGQRAEATASSAHNNSVNPADIAYVGDQVCAGCHQAQADRYREHPMHDTFAPISAVAKRNHYGAEQANPFEEFGWRFGVIPTETGVRHRGA